MPAAELWAWGGRWGPGEQPARVGEQREPAFAAEGQPSTGSVPGTGSLPLQPSAGLCLDTRESPASAMVGKKCKHFHGFCSDDGNRQIIRSRWKGWGRAEQKSDVSPWSLSQAVQGAGSAAHTSTHGSSPGFLPCLQGARTLWGFLPMFALKTWSCGDLFPQVLEIERVKVMKIC